LSTDNFLTFEQLTLLTPYYKNAFQRAGLAKRVTPMAIRHTAATHLLEAGLDSRYIQSWLGHGRLSTTQTYMKVTLSGLKKAVAACHPMERGRGK
jgi:site-specific recombinase XerD